MEFSIKSGSPEKQRTGCVVVGVFEGRKLTGSAQDDRPRASRAFLTRRPAPRRPRGQGRHDAPAAQRAEACPRTASCSSAWARSASWASRPTARRIDAAVKALRATGATEATFFLTDLALRKRDIAWKVEQAVLGHHARALYRFDRMKSKPPEPKRALRKVRCTSRAAATSPPARPPPSARRRSRRAWPSRATSATCPPTSARRPTSPSEAQELGEAPRAQRARSSTRRSSRSSAWAPSSPSRAAAASRRSSSSWSTAARKKKDARARGAGGQGRHLRHRRHLAQARARDGRDEVRHVRRGERARHDEGRRPHEAAAQRGRHRARPPRTCRAATPSSRATS